MFCEECGSVVDYGEKFCPECGASFGVLKKVKTMDNHMDIYYKYWWGGTRPRMTPKDIVNYKKLAEQGDVDAQYILALSHITGHGFEIDEVQGAVYLRKLADEGYEWAQLSLAHCYSPGLGSGGKSLPTDLDKALEYYQKAAAQGNYDARKRVYYILDHIEHRKKEKAKAKEKAKKQMLYGLIVIGIIAFIILWVNNS